MNNKLIISVYGDIDEQSKEALSEISSALVERSQLTGGGLITEAVILALTPLVIKGIKDVLLALIASNRNVSLKYKEIELHNISHNQVMDVIAELNKSSVVETEAEGE